MEKQKIIENYERQKQQYMEAGYEERQETISILRANVMAFVTAGPFVVLGLILWFCISFLAKEGTFVLGNQAVYFCCH